MELPDLRVLKRGKWGDSAAWEQVFKALMPCALDVARNTLCDSLQMMAEDVASIAFQHLYKYRNHLKSTSQLRPLLIVITGRVACSLLRYHLAQKRPDGSIVPPSSDSLINFIEGDLKVPLTMEQMEDLNEMAQIISQLAKSIPDKIKEVLFACFLEEKSDKEIATMLGLAASSIPVMRKRGIDAMRAALLTNPKLLSEVKDLLRLSIWMIVFLG